MGQAALLRAKDASDDARRAIVVQYVSLRDRRNAQDQELASLRQSLLAIATAHAALAAGAHEDLTTALARVNRELDATRALVTTFQDIKSGK